MNKTQIFRAAALAAVVLAAGCATTTQTEDEFGDSVREVMRKQVYDVNAGAYAGTKPVMGADPAKLETVLDAYRGGNGEGSQESYMTAPAQR